MDDYTHASWLRDQALLIEQHRTQRVARHDEYLADLHKGDPELLLALAAAQLNQIPVDRAPVPGLTQSTDPDAAVFGALEPDPIPLPDKPRVNTALHRLTTGETTRLWMIVISVVLILVGLLPQARSKPIPAQG
jgi:hypothetical protein